MTVFSLYLLSLPVGLAAILFAYKAASEDIGRGERIIWLACSLGLLLSVFLILLVMSTAL